MAQTDRHYPIKRENFVENKIKNFREKVMIYIHNENIQQIVSLKIVKSTEYIEYSKIYTRLINFNYTEFLKTHTIIKRRKRRKITM